MAHNKKISTLALSIRQPYADDILRGRKRVEYRSWRTHYRGRILIHASLAVDHESCRRRGLNPASLPTGAIIGEAQLVAIRKRGDHFAWALRNPRRFARPIRYRGKLGLFRVNG